MGEILHVAFLLNLKPNILDSPEMPCGNVLLLRFFRSLYCSLLCAVFSNICLLNSIWSILLDRSQTRLQIVLIPPALFIPVEYDAMERQKLIDAVPDSVTPLIIYEETTDIWINVRIWISALSDSLLFETPCAALGQSWCCCAVLPRRIFLLSKFCACFWQRAALKGS